MTDVIHHPRDIRSGIYQIGFETVQRFDGEPRPSLRRELASLAGRCTVVLTTHAPDRVAGLATTRLVLV